MIILFSCITFVLVLALVATQLKVRALAESCSSEKVRNDAQRDQFERDMRSLQMECEDLSGAAETRATRWKAVCSAELALGRASTPDERWARLAELFLAAGHFRVASVRLRDEGAQTFGLQHLLGLSDEKAEQLRTTRVPEPMLREWIDPRNGFGPGFVLRTKTLTGGVVNAPAAPLDPQDAWLFPFRDAEGRVAVYVSLAGPEPSRLPDADEMPFYQAAFDLCQAHLERQVRDRESNQSMVQRLRESQLEAAALAASRATLCQISERLRAGLGHVDGYAQNLLDYGRDLPGEEQKRLSRVIIEEVQEMQEDALLVADLAELTGGAPAEPGLMVEFSDLYAELLQFVLRRAETSGVTLNGPPLQGGLYIDRPASLLKRLLSLISNELLGNCSRGHELALSAWQDRGQVHITWRASGAGIRPPDPEFPNPRWVAAEAMSCALGGTLRESTFGADNRSVSLTIPLARAPVAAGPETRAA